MTDSTEYETIDFFTAPEGEEDEAKCDMCDEPFHAGDLEGMNEHLRDAHQITVVLQY